MNGDLFSPNPRENLLPTDGIVEYYGPILTPAEAQRYFQTLLEEVPWKNDEAVLFGKRHITARMVAWYGDAEYSYAYSGTTKSALPWTESLRTLKALIEERSETTYNSCLLNLYHHGGEGMGWHSDDEKSLAANSAIASVSLGAERKFSLRHKQTRETISLVLESGSLLVMRGTTQTHWQHCVPKTKKIHAARINLTFRSIRE